MATSYLQTLQAFVFWAFLLAKSTEGSMCPNRYYCHTDEVKYRSFTRMNDTYFNSTKVISSMPVTEAAQCMGKCNKISNCQSINHYFENKQSQMLCELIDGNKWSNASQIQRKQNSTHYFIQSPCSSIPCKNGGTCTPLYQSGTFKCDCSADNHTVWKTGKHCEILTASEETANVYYAFNEKRTFRDLRNTEIILSRIQGNTKVLSVPDRSSPVVYLAGEGGSYLKSSSYGTDCLVNLGACGSDGGLSVSFWFKILTRSRDRFPASDCSGTEITIVQTKHASKNTGFLFRISSCAKDSFSLRIRLKSSYYAITWGSVLNQTLYRSWSHVMFTARSSYGVLFYFNGKEVARNMQAVEAKTNTVVASNLLFGKYLKDFEVYLDDFAAWYFLLSANDVQAVYEAGLKRNRPKSAA